MKRTRVPAAKTALVTGVLALGLAGCSVTSPAVVNTPYAASDGINADLPGTDVVLRNLIIIGDEKGGEAELIGSVVNTGTADARITLQAAAGETGQPSQTPVTVAAGQAVQFGPASNQTEVLISDLAVEPGAVTGLTASTTSGGRVDLNVPVLPAEGDYAEVTPATSQTGAPSETADETATDGTGTQAEPTATATNNSKKNKKNDAATSTDGATATDEATDAGS